MSRFLVTGAAGFIGSNLCDRLLGEGHSVVGVDNFSTGRRRFLESALKSPAFELFERDLLDPKALDGLLVGVDQVFHLAANADVRDGLNHPRRDLEQNTIVTWNCLEAARQAGVKRFAFSSTGSVYGEAKTIPTPEDCPFPLQTSLYGASKLAGEGLIAAYAEGYGMQCTIFRFVSILGERYTHGHVYDFIKRLRQDPSKLRILGNGKQRKSYLHVSDCISAILSAVRADAQRGSGGVQVYNLGTDEYHDVNFSVDVISRCMKLVPKRDYAGGDRGWVGDNPFIFLDCKKIQSTGWKAKLTIEQSLVSTVEYLLANPWVFEPEGSGR